MTLRTLVRTAFSFSLIPVAGLSLVACGDSTKPANNQTDVSGGSGGSDGTGGDAQQATGGAGEPGQARSAGCGKAAPMTGERTIMTGGESGQYIVSIPADYSPDTAYTLGFAFHGYGRTHAECRQTDCAGFQSVMQNDAILIYMKSFSDGWEQDAVRDQNAKFFEDVLASVESELCVDENRVFVAGTSSGAAFTNVLGCRYGDKLMAIFPVAGGLPESEGCVGQVAYGGIHGIDDPHVTFAAGETARDFFRAQNNCGTTTVPELEAVHAEIRTSRDAKQTNQRCVDYQGCDTDFPVRWCEHSQGGYDDSTHGWPSAGGQLIWEFVSSL